MSLNFNSNFDEHRWVINIQRTLDEEFDHEDDNNIPVCIFSVPKTLISSDPESYTPHQVAIGPYHHRRPELYEMERYKLMAAKRTQKQLKCLKFQNLVEELIKLEPRVRTCYHKYLDFSGETLSWMMAIDASFLLEFLQIYAIKEGKVLSCVSPRMSHLVDYAGRNSGHDTILRDIVMLENQIPFFTLRKMYEFKFPLLESADDMLLSMLMGFCKELSPFKMMENLPQIEVSEPAHLLDFLYHMIVPKLEEPNEIDIEDDSEAHEEGRERLFANSNYVKQLLNETWIKLLSELNNGPVCFIKSVLLSRPVRALVKLPWTILSNLPGFAILKQLVKFVCFFPDKVETEPDNEKSNISKPPLVEEITIPSVTELTKAGIRFSPTNGNISTINFDVTSFTFYLPTVSLDLNAEVVLRNLVAYEASVASGPLVFTRYTELMNGIIDIEDDVKLLRARGIILNHLKSDEEAAKLWNGMSKSIRLTKVPFLDKAIEDINKYYDGRWCVKARKFMKNYVFGSWQFLTLLAAILLLFLMMLQVFCSVYSCVRIFRSKTTQRLP